MTEDEEFFDENLALEVYPQIEAYHKQHGTGSLGNSEVYLNYSRNRSRGKAAAAGVLAEFYGKDPLAWILLKPDRLAVMQHLKARSGSSIGRTASTLGLSEERVKRVIEGLEDRDLIAQKSPPPGDDGPTGWYHLTGRGREISSYWQEEVRRVSPKKGFWEKKIASLLYGDVRKGKSPKV